MKSLLKEVLPPILTRSISQFRSRSQDVIRFEGPYRDWADANARASGYDQQQILEKVKTATLQVKQGTAAYERDSILFDQIDYSWPLLAGVMWAAAQNQGKLDLLDFGGSLGSSYFQNRHFLQGLSQVSWSIIEQPHYVACGRDCIQDQHLKFYGSIDEYLQHQSPNAILCSGVLQYLADPWTLLSRMCELDAPILILDRMIVTQDEQDTPYLQIVPANIYAASYPCWSLSESKLLAIVSSNYRLVSAFPSLEFPVLATINSTFKGFIFFKK
jgi:putative methyltransferase (TIGR04325 family)